MARDYSKTPVRLQPQVLRALTVTSSDYPEETKALIARFKKWIEDHGLTFAVNQALRDLATQAGLKVSEIETPTARMAKAQRRRWKAVEAESREAEEKAEAAREARRERDKKRKAEQIAEPVRSSEHDPNDREGMFAPANPYNKL
jgi:hypothetical protein